jgi:hypothetical protein
LPVHVTFIALAFILAKLLNFVTIAWDTWEPIRQFPFQIRIVWDCIITLLAIYALHNLLTYEKYKMRLKRPFKRVDEEPPSS